MNNLKQLMLFVISSYPLTQISADTVVSYTLALQDLPFEDVKQAALDHLRTSPYFPTIAELSAVYNARIEAQVPTAVSAWGEVYSSFLRSVVDFSTGVRRDLPPEGFPSHPLIGEIVNGLGGYHYLYSLDDMELLRTHFLKAYESRRPEVVKQRQRDLLPGTSAKALEG